MRALPVEVVRALIAIVDCRGFTRAAERLGRTQPTISLQIRRLEELIGGPVFESTSRLTLTARGEIVLDRGRKLVAAHDELSDALTRQESGATAVRLGIASEFAALLAPQLVNLAQTGGESFEVTCDASEPLIAAVRAQKLDVALALSARDRAEGSLAHWDMPLDWIAAPRVDVTAGRPVRLVTTPEGSLFHTIAVGALQRAGRAYEIVCKSANPEVLRSAIDAGLGVSLAPNALAPAGARRLPEALLAPLPDVTLALYAREREAGAAAQPLLDRLIDVLRASPVFEAA